MALAKNPKVFVGLPHYGDAPVQCQLAAHAATDPDAGLLSLAEVRVYSISSLVNCFNALWAMALNYRDRGEATHFAMLHSDIEPQPGWLDALMTEMHKRPSAVVVSAVSCIKEQLDNPRTSTAYSPKGQVWGATRYVRRDDRKKIVEQFGETFGPESCQWDEQLLINTGCMLIDIRHAFWDGFAWEQPAIVQKDKDGVWQTAFEPEDWRMSRFLADRGIDYAATWAVKTSHHGAAVWPNY